MADLRDVVAGNIRAERARTKLRQMDLGAALNLSQPVMSDLENGRREITLSEALVICRELGVPLSTLTRGADPEALAVLGL